MVDILELFTLEEIRSRRIRYFIFFIRSGVVPSIVITHTSERQMTDRVRPGRVYHQLELIVTPRIGTVYPSE